MNENKNYNQILSETQDFFNAQGLNILGEGYKEIATDAALFESYVDQLTAGCSADTTAELAQLMVNSNVSILQESSITGIQPVASLSMPVIRKLWPMFALKNAIKTEVAKTPRFVVSYTKPYMYKGDDIDNRIYIPRGIEGANVADADGNNQVDPLALPNGLSKEATVVHTVELAAGAAAVVDFEFKANNTGEKDPHVYIADSPSAAKLQPLDELVFVSAVYGEDGSQKPIKIGRRLGVYGNGIYEFEGGQLIVQFDGKNRKATFAAIGAKVKLEVKAMVSSEYNEELWSVGFDVARRDIDIPTGQHLGAELPIEALSDMMALYQIDGTKEVTDLMTNVFAQRLDLEILNFLRDSYANQPTVDEFADYPGANAYTAVFDCKPAAGFAGGNKAWREEIKPLIDHLAQKIKNETKLQAGVFTIIGNPLDVQILANVDWSYRSGQGGNMDGVDVDYSIGTFVGANAYKVISSVNVPVGAMYILFTPSSEKQMTYKYYPYSFSVEHGYISPNRSRVPSLMMTKRHTFESFLPAIGAIIIQNNNAGGAWFNKYVSTKEYVGD